MHHRVSQLAISPPTKCLEQWHFAPCGKYQTNVLIERGQCVYKQRFGVFETPHFKAALRISASGDSWVFAIEDVGHESDVFVVALHGMEHWLLGNGPRNGEFLLVEWFHEHIGPLLEAKFILYDEDQLQQSVREAREFNNPLLIMTNEMYRNGVYEEKRGHMVLASFEDERAFDAYCRRERLVGTQAPPPPIRFLEIPFEAVPDFRGKPTDFAVGIAFGERCMYAAIFDKK
jgi:hypothetical protein